MKKMKTILSTLLILMASFALAAGSYAADDKIKMGTKELKEMMDKQKITVVDVRKSSDWKKSDKKITGAVREDPHNVSSWAGKYTKKETIVLYCA